MELPTGQRAHTFSRHATGAGFEHLEISQVARSIEFAFDDDAGMGKIARQIGAKALWASERSGVRGWIGLGELHNHRAERRVHIHGVIIAGKFAVEIKSSA